MNYKNHIQKVLIYIEENLKYDIDLDVLAKISGYSPYHFIRVFKEATHLTPLDYIRKRRISEIVKQMETDDRALSEIAFEFGFNSKENFTRAFKSEHHILPSEYKKAQNSLKLYDKPELETEPLIITPEILPIPCFDLTVYYSDEPYPPHFWNIYNCKKLSKKLSGGCTCEAYGVCIFNNAKQKIDYFVGIKKEEANGDISGTMEIRIPEGTYAVFNTPKTDHFNFVNTIHLTWEYINTVWLQQSGYERTGDYEFESYIENSRIFSEKIYIPIKKVQKASVLS